MKETTMKRLGLAVLVLVTAASVGCGKNDPATTPPEKPQAVESSNAPDLRVSLQNDEIPAGVANQSVRSKRIHILNRSTKPIKILGVSLNGEFDSEVVTKIAGGTHPERPVVLTVGDSALFLVSNQACVAYAAPDGSDILGELHGYSKAVIFIEVATDSGTYRYDF